MPLRDVARLCRAVVPGTGAVEVQPIACGLVSETYRVVRDRITYALKVAALHPMDFGLDRKWEAQVLERAGSSSLAPPLVFSDPQRGVMVSRWVVGRSWSQEEAKRPANIRKIAELLRRVQGLSIPQPPRVMSPMSWLQVYGAALMRQPRYAVDAALQRAADSRLHELEGLPAADGVVCHSDLHALNLIEVDDRLILLDWEYAHVADPLWDLAGWGANNDFEPQTQRELLTNYLGTAPTIKQWQRLRLLMWLYDYVCLLWSELYLNSRHDGVNIIRERATQLDARLHLPAHYAA
jgi:thiamine kinase-like enzyme